MLELKEIELTEEQKKQERMDNLQKLYQKASAFVDQLKEAFPNHEIKIHIDEREDNYWFDGDCYSIEEHFYLPNK